MSNAFHRTLIRSEHSEFLGHPWTTLFAGPTPSPQPPCQKDKHINTTWVSLEDFGEKGFSLDPKTVAVPDAPQSMPHDRSFHLTRHPATGTDVLKGGCRSEERECHKTWVNL